MLDGPAALPILAVAATLAIGVIFGIACVIVGAWGWWRALRKGRACPVCGLWADPVDILIHECLDHESK